MISIRKYRPEDKPFLQEICRITAHGSYKRSPEALSSVTVLYNDYYTENEPENIFVAADENDRPVGYILCSADEKKFRKEMKTTYKKRLQAVCPIKKADALAARLLTCLLPKKYRVHLHIDILPGYQRLGIGSRLMNALRTHLSKKEIPFLTVLSVSTHSDGYAFYKRYGFTVLRRWLPGESALTISTRVDPSV